MTESAETDAQSGSAVDLTIFVPCHNEEALVARTLDTIREATSHYSFSYEVLIYDDGSTDRTGEIVSRYIEENDLADSFELVVCTENAGIGVNYFRAAEKGVGEYFIVLFGDNSESVESMDRVFDLMGKADVVIPYIDCRLFNSRFNSDKRGIFRRFCSITFARLVRMLSGHRIRYFNGFVLHRRKNVLKHRVDAYGLGYQAELLCSIVDEPGITFLEVRVSCADRTSGTPTAFRPRNVVSVGASLWRIFWRRMRGPDGPRYRA